MRIIANDLWVCTDCLFFIENGELPENDPPRAAEVRESVRGSDGVWAADWDSDTEEGIDAFSKSPCDCCNSSLFGERHRYSLLSN